MIANCFTIVDNLTNKNFDSGTNCLLCWLCWLDDHDEAAGVISFRNDAPSQFVIAGDFSKTDEVMSGTYFLSNRPDEIVVDRWSWFDDFVRDFEENIGICSITSPSDFTNSFVELPIIYLRLSINIQFLKKTIAPNHSTSRFFIYFIFLYELTVLRSVM